MGLHTAQVILIELQDLWSMKAVAAPATVYVLGPRSKHTGP